MFLLLKGHPVLKSLKHRSANYPLCNSIFLPEHYSVELDQVGHHRFRLKSNNLSITMVWFKNNSLCKFEGQNQRKPIKTKNEPSHHLNWILRRESAMSVAKGGINFHWRWEKSLAQITSPVHPILTKFGFKVGRIFSAAKIDTFHNFDS